MTWVLYEYAMSGNCYKIRLAAAYAGVPLERREYDIVKGETRTPEFLRDVNDNGRIPVLDTPEGKLPESNAACYYLLRDTPLIPREPFAHAQLLRWLFWEQYNHEPNIATMRFWRAFVGEENLNEVQRANLPGKVAAGEAALKLMHDHVASRAFMLGERSRSPTSRSTPTRTRRRKVAFGWLTIRTCRHGSRVWRASRGISRSKHE